MSKCLKIPKSVFLSALQAECPELPRTVDGTNRKADPESAMMLVKEEMPDEEDSDITKVLPECSASSYDVGCSKYEVGFQGTVKEELLEDSYDDESEEKPSRIDESEKSSYSHGYRYPGACGSFGNHPYAMHTVVVKPEPPEEEELKPILAEITGSMSTDDLLPASSEFMPLSKEELPVYEPPFGHHLGGLPKNEPHVERVSALPASSISAKSRAKNAKAPAKNAKTPAKNAKTPAINAKPRATGPTGMQLGCGFLMIDRFENDMAEPPSAKNGNDPETTMVLGIKLALALKIVAVIQKHRSIWDPSHKLNSVKSPTDKVFKKICLMDASLTVPAVKKMWYTLRSQYLQKLRIGTRRIRCVRQFPAEKLRFLDELRDAKRRSLDYYDYFV